MENIDKEIIVLSIDDKEKKTRNKQSKAERYIKERTFLIKELEELIGLTEDNKSVLLYDLEHNNELKMKLKEKIPVIKQLFKTGNWNYFVQQHNDNREISEISLLKMIFKDFGYTIANRRRSVIREDVKKQYVELVFSK